LHRHPSGAINLSWLDASSVQKTSPHNQVFIDGVRATLTTDPGFQNGIFVTRPEPGLRAMGRNYAAMAMSQTFYREEVWRQAGFSSLEDLHVMSCAIQLESEY
jgi:homoserine O-acetyltransferase